MDRYDFSNMNFPATAMDLQIFQQQNENIAINALMFVKEGKSSSCDSTIPSTTQNCKRPSPDQHPVRRRSLDANNKSR